MRSSSYARFMKKSISNGKIKTISEYDIKECSGDTSLEFENFLNKHPWQCVYVPASIDKSLENVFKYKKSF